MSRLMSQYNNEIKGHLKDELGIANPMAVPRLEKVVVSMGVGDTIRDKNRMGAVVQDLAMITGQKAQITKARKSVSNFKLRAGMEIGCRVTLRGRRMYEFVERLVNTAIPRLRDFRGLNPRSFDGHGNYSMGLQDQSIFAEIDAANIAFSQGMNITFVTSAQDDRAARVLLTQLGMPFRRTEEQAN